MRHRAWTVATVVMSFVVANLFAEEKAALPPYQQIDGIGVKESAFRQQGHSKPYVIKNRDDAAVCFAVEEVEKLAKQVNFERQIVLVFAWRGSGQDKLEVAVMESMPEQLSFNYVPGRTRDLRPHVAIFAVRSDVTWLGKPDPDAKPKD